MNYWRDKPAGEEFTHILPHESIFMRKNFDFAQSNEIDIQSAILETTSHRLSIANDSTSLFPSSHTPIHISLDRDFKDDLWYWQQQIIPPFYHNFIFNHSQIIKSSRNISVIPSHCEGIAMPFHSFQTISQNYDLLQLQRDLCSQKDSISRQDVSPSAFVFHLPKSSILDLVKSQYSNYTLHNWMSWILKPGKGNSGETTEYEIQIIPTALKEDTRKWKESMPGRWQESRIEEL